MQTPAGKECTYFYGDYFRGRKTEECRLLQDSGLAWEPNLCSRCPIPEFQQANSCENMRFRPSIQRPFLIGKPSVLIETYCEKCTCSVEEPRIGCGQCHPLPDIFIVGPDDDNLTR